jgi:hypothetical protein
VTVSASYDPAGHLKTLTYPDGRVVTNFFYDSGWFNYTREGTTDVLATVNSYWPSGAWNNAQYGNGAQQYDSYNNHLQTQELKLVGAAAQGFPTLADKVYSYDMHFGEHNPYSPFGWVPHSSEASL